jgi:hypothetical protein
LAEPGRFGLDLVAHGLELILVARQPPREASDEQSDEEDDRPRHDQEDLEPLAQRHAATAGL